MPRIVRTAAVLTAIAFTSLVSAASARQVDVPARLTPVISKAQASGLVILLPAALNLDYERSGSIYAAGSGSKRGADYALTLSATRDCTGNACFLAQFLGEKDKALGYQATNVQLALGTRGYYQPRSCGASCSPPSIQWIQKGVRYEIQAKALGGKQAFASMANSAIRAGNRT